MIPAESHVLVWDSNTKEMTTNNDDGENHLELKPLDQKLSSSLALASYEQIHAKPLSETSHRCAGILYAIVASFLFTCSTFIIKQLRADILDVLLSRFILQTAMLAVFLIYKRYPYMSGSASLVALQVARGIFASSGVTLFFVSYRFIPLPDLSTVRHTQVAWIALLSMIIFRERISIPTITAIIMTLVGVVCVAQPTFLFPIHRSQFNATPEIMFRNDTRLSDLDREVQQVHRLLGLCLAFACAFSISLSVVLNKKLIEYNIKQSVLLMHFASFTLVVVALNHLRNRFFLHTYAHRTMFTWRFLVASAVSLLQVLSSTLTQRAIKLEHPSTVTVVQSSEILFALLLQNLIATAKSNWLIILGSALVTISIFIVGLHKIWQDRKRILVQNKNRNNLT